MAHVHGAKTVAAATGAGAAAMMASMSKANVPLAQSAIEAAGVGVAVAAGTTSTFKKLVTQPLVVFGLGFSVGYYAYKYRKQILSSAHQEEIDS